jgi:hypothetical protein
MLAEPTKGIVLRTFLVAVSLPAGKAGLRRRLAVAIADA